MQKQSVTTSHNQTNSLPISEQQQPWKTLPSPLQFLIVEHDIA